MHEDDLYGYTPLTLAIKLKKWKIVLILLKNGSNLDDHHHSTIHPLLAIIKSKQVEVFEEIIKLKLNLELNLKS